MNLPYTITVQFNAAKCGWTVICNDDADNLVGVRYYGQMDKAVSFAHSQCYKILDHSFTAALHVFDRKGDRSYSVGPEQFERGYQRDIDQKVAKDFALVGGVLA